MLDIYLGMEDGPALMKEAREASGLSRVRLAILANTSAQQIERLENGKRKLTRAWAERVGPHIGISPLRLVFGRDFEAEPPKSETYDSVFLEELLASAFAAFGISGSDARTIASGIIGLARAGRKTEQDHAKLLNQLLFNVLIEREKPKDG